MSDLYKDIPETLKKGIEETGKQIGKGLKNTMPYYYHKGGMDVIGFMETKASKEEMRGFFRGNILKYVTRFHEKNGVDDLKKADYYLQRLIELESERNGTA